MKTMEEGRMIRPDKSKKGEGKVSGKQRVMLRIEGNCLFKRRHRRFAGSDVCSRELGFGRNRVAGRQIDSRSMLLKDFLS